MVNVTNIRDKLSLLCFLVKPQTRLVPSREMRRWIAQNGFLVAFLENTEECGASMCEQIEVNNYFARDVNIAYAASRRFGLICHRDHGVSQSRDV